MPDLTTRGLRAASTVAAALRRAQRTREHNARCHTRLRITRASARAVEAFATTAGAGARSRRRSRGSRRSRRSRRRSRRRPPRDPVQLWDSSVKWFFDENGGSKAPLGEDMKGMNKKRAREYHVSGRERSRAPAAEAAAAKASLELRRFKLVKRLRHQLALRCGALGITPPLLAFERWLCRAMLQGGDAVPVPMLPAVDAGGGLGRDLHRRVPPTSPPQTPQPPNSPPPPARSPPNSRTRTPTSPPPTPPRR